VWDLEAGKETRTLRGHTYGVLSLALSGDGKRLCSGNGDQTIKVWDLEAGKETRTLGVHTGRVITSMSLALSADGTYGTRLFSGSYDQTIKVWDLEAAKESLALRGHTDRVLSLALSADGKRLFSGSGDQTIKVWDLEAGKETLTLRRHTGRVNSLALYGVVQETLAAGAGRAIGPAMAKDTDGLGAAQTLFAWNADTAWIGA
jgi:WD40 repeat protein